MAANANPNLSTVAEEGEAVVEVFVAGNAVVVKWGEGGAKQTRATHSTLYSESPYYFSAFDTNGDEPVIKTFGTLLGCNGGTLTIGQKQYRVQVIEQQQLQQLDNSDIKQLAEFARDAMESKTEKRDMSKASSQFAQELVAALGIVVETLEPNEESTGATEPLHYSWNVTTVAGDTVKLGEHQGTPGARKWFHDNFLSGGDLENDGYCIKVATGALLPILKAGGKKATGKADMVIGKEGWIKLADSVYEQAPGVIELKTDEYPIKVGQLILELTSFSMISRFGRGVVLLASDCNEKWRLLWFQNFNTIYRRNYKSARKCWIDFVALLKDAEDRNHSMEPPRKKRLAILNEDQENDQDLSSFDLGEDKKQKAVENEAMLHHLADYLGDLYGERPVVPDWARAERVCPDYYA